MAQSHTPVHVEPEALQRASDTWDGFVYLLKYGTIAVIAVLVCMAVFLL